MRNLLLLFIASLIPLLAGCEDGCPYVKKISEASSDPALVEMTFSVQCGGEPVTAITASDLALTENGETVSRSESDWVVHKVAAVLETYTLLLIDISDSVTEEGSLEVAQEVAVDFVEAVLEQGQLVSVAVFDGDPSIRTVVDFTGDIDELTEAIEGIGPEDRLDGSTNLNGAILAGLEILDGQVVPDVESELESVANLVVFTDGTDSAQRESDGAAQRAVDGSDHEVFVVGLVGDEDVEELEQLGKAGFFQAADKDALVDSFQALTDSLVAEVNKFYRLSYCSPLRSPRTTLKVEIAWDDGQDTIETTYDTAGFGPGCQLPSD